MPSSTFSRPFSSLWLVLPGAAFVSQLALAQTPPAAASASGSASASSPASAALGTGTPETTLPGLSVKAQAVRDASSEGTGSYAPAAVSIGKDARSLREVPHSVTVITREQLNDQNIVSVEAALKNVTGVTIQRYDATGSYTQFIARGYAADSYLLDGLTVQTDTNGIYFDLAAFDRVEVQRGAASLFSGAGEPGVTVNMARKRAMADFKAEGALSLSSWDDRRIDLDVTGKLNTSGSLRGRAVAVVQDFDTFMDGIDNNRKRMVYGTLEADVAERSTLSVGLNWQQVDTVLSRGLPTWANAKLIDMPRSTMPIQAWNRQQLDSFSAFAEFERRGADDSLLKLALRHMKRGNKAKYLDPSIPAADGTMNALAHSAFEREDSDDTLDLYYSKPFMWNGLEQNLLVGADYRQSRADTHYAGFITMPNTVSLNLFRFDPYAIPEPVFDLNSSISQVDVKAYGAYTQLRVKPVVSWTLIGGGRLSSWESTGISFGTPTSYSAKNKFIPYFAAIYDLSRALSLYGSYNQIYKAQNNRTASGEQIEPRTGRQVEFGLKGELDRGRVAYTAAIYRLIDQNRALADPAYPNGNFSIPSGKARAQGVEVDVHGEVTSNISVSGGYARTDTKYLVATAAQQGTPVSTFTPRHNYNLWARYKVTDGAATGLVLGAGLRGMSDFYNGSGASLVRAPGYTLFGLNAAYPISERYRVTLNVDNLFDKVYWEKVSYPGRQNFFGEPRRVTLAVRGSF